MYPGQPGCRPCPVEVKERMLEWWGPIIYEYYSATEAKCPRTVDFEDSLPRHPTGKLYKQLLKDRYWRQHQSKII